MQNRPPIRPGQDLAARLSLAALPACFMAAALAARSAGGPTWLWFNLDPDYFYLLDALNIVNLTTPGHVYHPGVAVEWLAALVLKAAHPFDAGAAIAAQVLVDPEHHLRLIGDFFIVLGALALLAVGVVGRRVFGGLTAPWLLQMAPFLSMVILKQSYRVKPESLLVLTTLALIAVATLTLEPGLMERHRRRFAVGFGVIAGFGVATKITALPVFLLPVFVLGGPRWIALYAASAFAALIVFTLPAVGAYDVFLAWMTKVSLASSAYGGGPAGVIDWARYPAGVAKLVRRPAFVLPLALGALALAWAAWRRNDGRPLPAPEVRLIAGIVAAQLAHVLMVAKQPNAIYLIPSLALSALAIVGLWRLAAAIVGEGAGARRLERGMSALLALLLVAQAAGVAGLARGLADDRDRALAVDDGRFRACARVYSYSASSPSFALMLGDFMTGSRFVDRLAGILPANDYWLEHWWDQSRVVFRAVRGPADMTATLARYPCAVLRGGHWPLIKTFLGALAPGLSFDATCSTRDETIFVNGAGCEGKPGR